jgi:hypothetical protein
MNQEILLDRAGTFYFWSGTGWRAQGTTQDVPSESIPLPVAHYKLAYIDYGQPVSGTAEEIRQAFPPDSAGVHATHCCTEHGCKYGDAGCPVADGTVQQDYPCEFCEET